MALKAPLRMEGSTVGAVHVLAIVCLHVSKNLPLANAMRGALIDDVIIHP